MGQILSLPGTGHLGFGAAVSSVVGDYIVGAVIQPDYGRFVRRPAGAAAGAAGALAVVLPLVLVASAVPGLMVGKDNLIAAMIALGFGLPALAVLLMGAWIDASACLYSGGLSLANQFPRFDFRTIIAGSALVGVVLALARVDTLFVPFLVALGVALPPIAAVQVVSALRRPPHTIEAVALRPAALLAWAAGTLAGVLTSYEVISISGIAAVDSVLVAGAVALVTSFTRSDR
jgi:cytosine permease